ncbi:MAG: YicC family protein [Candidatus Omnitrophica bacterium]|nr:YicC family protein [Candidatus Omnitrophota bacterium]
MIKGMTGFGSVQIVVGKVKGILEMKSQNHRYLDVVYYLPIGFSSVENKIRQVINKEMKRGRVIVFFKIIEKPSSRIMFNKDAVQQYMKHAKTLKKEYGIKDQLRLSDLVKMPGVFEAREIFVSVDEVWPAIEKGLVRATKSLVAMRKREGKSLTVDVVGNLKRMQMQIKKIEQRAKAKLKEKKKKFSPEEFLSCQKSWDINEELARSTHYIDEFRLLLKSQGSVGKKLDFVAQEMQREANTIGSKMQDKVVANAVISIKSKIEKLREQAQNIE